MGDGAMVHADRVDEIARLDAAAGRAGGKTVAIGLRVSFDDGGADWDRFGLSPGRGELAAALAQIDASAHLVLGGLHAHVGTNLRDVGRFERLGAQLADLARALGRPLRWIDAGGGLAGANPRWDEAPRRHAWPDARAWCAAVLGPLVAANAAPRYVLEPGRTVIEPAGALLARVAGVRVAADGRPAYVIDGGINAVPTALTYRHPVRTPGAAGPVAPSALYGPLCLQKDRIAEAALLPRLGRGDLVLVEGVGAYNVSRAVAFIQPRPGALLWRGGDEACWLREPEDVDDLMAREPPRTRSGGARIGAPKR
jgi:diaminopimelate decarboxylase